MKVLSSILLAGCLVSRLSAAVAGAPELKDGLPLLFADDSVLARKSNVERIIHPARRENRPTLSPELRCEGDRVYVYGSVWPEGDGWRLWYGASSSVCIADSKDGIVWTRRNPNVVTKGFHSPSVLLDRFEKDPSRRYKIVGSQHHRGADGKVDRERTGYYSACSPDGRTWSEPRQIVKGWWDTVTMAQDPRTGEYLVYHKHQVKWRGHPGSRIVYLTRSKDFEHWSEPELVFAPDDEDNRGWPVRPEQHMEVYNFSVLPHAGGYLAFPTMFHVTGTIPHPAKKQSSTDGYIDVQLATSTDGVRWSRTPGRTPVLPLGAPGSFDGGTILGISNSALTRGDESMMYYTAVSTSHGGALPEKKLTIGRATWRRYGWTSLAAKGKGSFTTVPVTLTSPEIRVNFRTFDPKGGVRVAIAGPDGKPMRGLGLNDCVRLSGDDTQASVKWKSGAAVPAGKPVSIRCELDRAEIYSIECTEPKKEER